MLMVNKQQHLWLGLQKSTVWVQITPSYIIINVSSSKWNISILSALKDSPLNSAFVVKILCYYFKQIVSYKKTKLKK